MVPHHLFTSLLGVVAFGFQLNSPNPPVSAEAPATSNESLAHASSRSPGAFLEVGASGAAGHFCKGLDVAIMLDSSDSSQAYFEEEGKKFAKARANACAQCLQL